MSFSLTHKGSSSVDQVANPGTSAPAAPVEIDVMLIFKDVKKPSLDRVKAIEEDVRALVSLAKVTGDLTWTRGLVGAEAGLSSASCSFQR